MILVQFVCSGTIIKNIDRCGSNGKEPKQQIKREKEINCSKKNDIGRITYRFSRLKEHLSWRGL